MINHKSNGDFKSHITLGVTQDGFSTKINEIMHFVFRLFFYCNNEIKKKTIKCDSKADDWMYNCWSNYSKINWKKCRPRQLKQQKIDYKGN